MILDQISRKSDRKIIELKFKIELKHGREERKKFAEKFMHGEIALALSLPHSPPPFTCRVPFERRK
jgi:hypothetical protein